MISATNKFAVWKLYRTHVLPICIGIALLSILFGGALVVEHSLVGKPGLDQLDANAFNKIVVLNLFAASILMACHLLYMALMAYHLVYRFPIENKQLVSLVYLLILFAFLAHAFHSYSEATGYEGIFSAAWLSSGAFSIAYVVMVIHGLLEERSKEETKGSKRSTQKIRGQWMLRTDIGIACVAILMLLRAAGILDWSHWCPNTWAAPVMRFFSKFPLLIDIYTQCSPKDVIIALALVVYFIVKQVAHHYFLRGQQARREKILTIQSLDPNTIVANNLKSALPQNAVWLDLASGQGSNLRELIDYLFSQSQSYPTEIIYLDKDCQALMDSSANAPQSWPSTLKQSYQHAGLRTAKGKEALERSSVVHLGHVAYSLTALRDIRHLLRFAVSGTFLLIRYTSNASFYRVISASTSCSVLRPYIYHHTHQLLLQDLQSDGWEKVGQPYFLPRHCDVSQPIACEAVINWCDAEYGEFSGDIIERYIEGFASEGETRLLNADSLILLKKK